MLSVVDSGCDYVFLGVIAVILRVYQSVYRNGNVYTIASIRYFQLRIVPYFVGDRYCKCVLISASKL